MKKECLLTSESVSEGHPDKVADQVSDVILDVFLATDVFARVACETLVTKGVVVVAGQISSCCRPSIPDTVRWLIKDIGYTDVAYGFDHRSCRIITHIDKQSPEISRAIEGEGGEIRAGDQVTVFGYATNGHHAGARACIPTGGIEKSRRIGLAAPGCKVAGDCPLCWR